MAIEVTFLDYYAKLETNYLLDNFIYKIQEEAIQKDFDNYGLTEMEKAQLMLQFRSQITLGIEKQTTDAVMALLKLEQDKLLQDANINKINADKLLIDEQLKLVTAKTATEGAQRALLSGQLSLIGSQITTEDIRRGKLTADTNVAAKNALKIVRDTDGYDDQILLKLVDAQAKLASFAVNVGSTEATVPINNLITLINRALARAGSGAL